MAEPTAAATMRSLAQEVVVGDNESFQVLCDLLESEGRLADAETMSSGDPMDAFSTIFKLAGWRVQFDERTGQPRCIAEGPSSTRQLTANSFEASVELGSVKLWHDRKLGDVRLANGDETSISVQDLEGADNSRTEVFVVMSYEPVDAGGPDPEIELNISFPLREDLGVENVDVADAIGYSDYEEDPAVFNLPDEPLVERCRVIQSRLLKAEKDCQAVLEAIEAGLGRSLL